MIIDFDKAEEQKVEGFKGGNGAFLTRRFDDGNVKIMKNILPPASSIGLHEHIGNCEVMLITKGIITFTYDGKQETASAGQIHYCPNGHQHMAENLSDEDAEFIAFVPEMKG